MSFRNRPVLDRKHRPRWQDELRTQQLIVAGFAVAIAVAIGIFAANAWSEHYDAHLRPVAAVGDATFSFDDLTDRMDVISVELQARYEDLQSRMGGVRDPQIQQALQSIQEAINALGPTAAESLVLGPRAQHRGGSLRHHRQRPGGERRGDQASDRARAAEAVADHGRCAARRREARRRADRRRLGTRRGGDQRDRGCDRGRGGLRRDGQGEELRLVWPIGRLVELDRGGRPGLRHLFQGCPGGRQG